MRMRRMGTIGWAGCRIEGSVYTEMSKAVTRYSCIKMSLSVGRPNIAQVRKKKHCTGLNCFEDEGVGV